MKKYSVKLAKTFMSSHPRKGEETGFKEEFLSERKKHTIRQNYEEWRRRFTQIEQGQACLAVEEWSGKPFKSKVNTIKRLTNRDEIGLAKLSFDKDILIDNDINQKTFSFDSFIDILASHDGLLLEDFLAWFPDIKNHKEPLALIYLCSFRY